MAYNDIPNPFGTEGPLNQSGLSITLNPLTFLFYNQLKINNLQRII
jgi:hypothetical protein